MDLVTGATGHIGNVLARELLARGERVRALVLPGEDTLSLEGLAVEQVEGNILDLDSIRPAFEGINHVYHLAGLISIMPGDEERIHSVNVLGTQNVLTAAREAGVGRLVYTSSIHAIFRAPEGMVIDESLPFDPHCLAGVYDRSKAEASLKVLEMVQQGLDAVIVCPTGVIGPYDFRRSEMGECVLDWMNGKLHFLVDGSFDFVDVRDVVNGLILAGEKGRRGESYIISGERINLHRLYGMVQEIIGLGARGVNIPFWLAKAVTPFTTLYYRLSRQRPRFTSYSLETVQSNSVISSAKARRELGYLPRSMVETVRDTVQWWLEHRLLKQSQK